MMNGQTAVFRICFGDGPLLSTKDSFGKKHTRRRMANVHGLFSGNRDDDEDEDTNNNRYVGGVDSRGGGRYDKQ